MIAITRFKQVFCFFCILMFFSNSAVAQEQPVIIEAEQVNPVNPVNEDPFSLADKQFQDLAVKYGLQSCQTKNKDTDDDKDDDDDDDDKKDKDKKDDNNNYCTNEKDYFYFNLKDTCQKAKDNATECCNDPHACESTLKKVAVYGSPLAVELMSIIYGYKQTKDVKKKVTLTDQEKSDEICNATNKAYIGMYTGQIMGQVLPYIMKQCADQIKKCKKTCDNIITQFKTDLRQIYNIVSKKTNIEDTIKIAKKCLYGDENEDLTNPSFEPSSSSKKSFNISGNKFLEAKDADTSISLNCHWGKGSETSTEEIQEGEIKDHSSNDKLIKFLSQVIFYAKAYQSSLKKTKEPFSFKEKEVVDCANQPDRIVDTNKKANITLPKLIKESCKTIQKARTSRTPYPKNPPKIQFTGPNGTTPIGGLQGNTANQPSYIPPILGGGNNGNEDLDPGLPEPPNRPKLVETPPGFAPNSSGGGGSGGSSGGLAGGSGGGGSGYDDGNWDDNNWDNNDYPGSFGGSFSGGDYSDQSYPMGSGEGGMDYMGDRDMAFDDNDDDDKEYPDWGDDKDSMEGDGNIFEMASKNIKYFCSGLKCAL